MSRSSRTRVRLTRRQAAAAWLVTGPLGHLAAGVLDWLALAAHVAWARARGRRPW